MSPQLVDFNADGHLDIVAGTFSGSPHVAFGAKDGYAQPVQILDGAGARILLNAFWNYDTEQWETTQRCDEPTKEVPEGHATSAVAWDWDADGDLDLLLGDYRTGRIYRRMNEGKAREPKFAVHNLALQEGGEALRIPAKIETMRLVDWDEDGLPDLLCGSVESSDPDKEPAGVYWVRNIGKGGEPVFAAPRALIVGEPMPPAPPARPYGGFYPEACDLDRDGDLDLIVGAKSQHAVPARRLSAQEQGHLAELEAELAQLQKSISDFYERLTQDSSDPDPKVAETKMEQLLEERSSEVQAHFDKQAALLSEKEALAPGPKRGYQIFYYENLRR